MSVKGVLSMSISGIEDGERKLCGGTLSLVLMTGLEAVKGVTLSSPCDSTRKLQGSSLS